jgi:hypothetical protein
MRRVFAFLHRSRLKNAQVWELSPDQRHRLLGLLSEIGLGIVSEARGPVPLLKFGRSVLERLEGAHAARVPLPDFADALKHVIREMEDDKLRVMSPTDFVGVGYVYNAVDPETWPIRSSR